jgi:hypothetical protein
MKHKVLSSIASGLFLSVSCLFNIAQADLIQADYTVVGDNSAVFDTNQDLKWLDLSVSRHWSTSTWSTLVQQNAGWRLANNSEVESLLVSAFPNVTDPVAITATSYAATETAILGDIDSFYTLFGATWTNTRSYGFYEDESSIWRLAGVDNYSGHRTIWGGEYGFNYNSTVADGWPSFGLYIVTSTVPEPTIIALFGLGLFGIGFSRKRKAHS